MSSEDFADAAGRIERNPLGRLMYGQRELFHSNLLAWFFDELPDEADTVFRPLTTPGEDRGRWVDRERQHLDLAMHWPDRTPLVIENKVFSIPGAAQLDEYASVVAGWKQTPSLVLLSVSEPAFDLGKWSHLSYAGLADRIDAALPADASYEVETMRRYSALVRDLHALVSAVDVASTDERVWLPDAMLEVISSPQMRSALHKARAHRVARAVNAAVPEADGRVASGMTNSQPLVEWFERVDTRGLELHLGWQLQGTQFRRAMVHHDPAISGRTPESRAAREEVSRAHPDFFALPAGLPQAYGGRGEFNHYAPNFVYRYTNAPDITVAQLLAAARTVQADTAAFNGA